MSGSEIGPGNTKSDFVVEFIGINTVAGVKQQKFHLTGTVPSANGINIPIRSKRFFIGAHRQNFTGSLITETDVKISSCRFWQLDLDYEEILAHASDPENYGVFNPTQNAYLLNSSDAHLAMTDDPYPFEVPKVKTLLLNWNFANLSGSDVSVDGFGGEFEVLDFTGTGSSDNPYPGTIINTLFQKQHAGRGLFFPSRNKLYWNQFQEKIFTVYPHKYQKT